VANFTMLAQNSKHNYVQQAYLCALSIRATNPNSKICLITNDIVDAITSAVFDDIVAIPWNDHAANSEWKVENRWKLYHATPYDRTIVLDTDMLVLENIEHWWNFLQTKDIFFTSTVLTYRNTPVTSTYYRTAFAVHNLPNIYAGLYYFKKSAASHKFFKWLEIVMNNWQLFYYHYAGGSHFQKWPSIDVSAAIVIKILDIKNAVTSNTYFPNFVHMKTHCQDWKDQVSDRWQDTVSTYLDQNLTLKIGNYTQRGIFHYTEKDFITNELITIYEDYIKKHNE